MRISKYLLGFALLALGMSMTSCDQENEGAIYTSNNKNVSWEQKALSTTTAENEIVVPVMITRNVKDGELTVNYTVENSDPDVLSDDCNGKVTFANGESTAFVRVKAQNMEKGSTYTYTMNLDDATIDPDETLNNVTKSVTVQIISDYTWVDAGTCTFIDGNFSEEGQVEDVPVVKALEATNPLIFRIIEPYQMLFAGTDDEKYFTDADNIEFYLDPQGNPLYIKNGAYVAGYTIDYFTDQYLRYCYFLREGNLFTVGHLLGVDGTPTYVGGFQFIYDPVL